MSFPTSHSASKNSSHAPNFGWVIQAAQTWALVLFLLSHDQTVTRSKIFWCQIGLNANSGNPLKGRNDERTSTHGFYNAFLEISAWSCNANSKLLTTEPSSPTATNILLRKELISEIDIFHDWYEQSGRWLWQGLRVETRRWCMWTGFWSPGQVVSSLVVIQIDGPHQIC